MKATFMCHECKKIFQSGSELYKEVLTHGKPTLSCDKCNKTFRLSKVFNRHLMSVYGRVDGLKCNFEQCSVTCQRLSEIKEYIREAHSVKDFVFGNHFSLGRKLPSHLSHLHKIWVKLWIVNLMTELKKFMILCLTSMTQMKILSRIL